MAWSIQAITEFILASSLHWSILNGVLLLAIFAVFTFYRHLYLGSKHNLKRLPYPPGPKRSPIIGNLHDMPTSHPWLKFTAWAKQYGDIVHVENFGNHIIYLNTVEAANELLDKRSIIYSSRPRMVMIPDLMGWDWSFHLMSYGPLWQKRRKLFHQYFNWTASEKYSRIQTLEARKMLLRLAESPEKFFDHIERTSMNAILRIVYGIDTQRSQVNDTYLSLVKTINQGLCLATEKYPFLVDIVPVLRYIPGWFSAKMYKEEMNVFRELPFMEAKKQMEIGGHDSVVSEMFTNMVKKNAYDANEDIEETIRSVTGLAFFGGSTVNTSLIQSFVLEVVQNPILQNKAQEELDRVIGKDRLPTFSDRPSLPYVEAIVMEVLRLHPVAPYGIPHMVDEDDEYRGYFIPKNSVVMANIWHMLRDESIYPNPEMFSPERFLDEKNQLNPSIPHPRFACFGFGRRKCPGQPFGVDGAWIAIASMLATLKFNRAVDENGNPISVKNEYTSGTVSYPLPFKCSIQPRTESTVNLITTSLDVGLSSSRGPEM